MAFAISVITFLMDHGDSLAWAITFTAFLLTKCEGGRCVERSNRAQTPNDSYPCSP
jgi:hypothetical protein